MSTLRPKLTQRLRRVLLVAVLLLVIAIATHMAGLTTLAAVLTPLAGIALIVLGGLGAQGTG